MLQKDLVFEECITCGVTFAMTHTLHQHVKDHKKSFYCPNGHSMAYTKSRAELLQETIDQKNREISTLRTENETLSRKLRRKAAKKQKA